MVLSSELTPTVDRVAHGGAPAPGRASVKGTTTLDPRANRIGGIRKGLEDAAQVEPTQGSSKLTVQELWGLAMLRHGPNKSHGARARNRQISGQYQLNAYLSGHPIE